MIHSNLTFYPITRNYIDHAYSSQTHLLHRPDPNIVIWAACSRSSCTSCQPFQTFLRTICRTSASLVFRHTCFAHCVTGLTHLLYEHLLSLVAYYGLTACMWFSYRVVRLTCFCSKYIHMLASFVH